MGSDIENHMTVFNFRIFRWIGEKHAGARRLEPLGEINGGLLAQLSGQMCQPEIKKIKKLLPKIVAKKIETWV